MEGVGTDVFVCMHVCIKIPAILSVVRARNCGEGIKPSKEGQGTKYERGHSWLEKIGLEICYVSSVISWVTKVTNGSTDA